MHQTFIECMHNTFTVCTQAVESEYRDKHIYCTVFVSRNIITLTHELVT